MIAHEQTAEKLEPGYKPVGYYAEALSLASARVRALIESNKKIAHDITVARAEAIKASETASRVRDAVHRIGGSHAMIMPSGEVLVRGGIQRKVPL